MQGAAGVEQAIDALAHFPIDVGHGFAANPWRGLDFAGLLLVAHVDARAGHGLDDTIVFELAVDLADRVAMQARLHGQLARTGQAMARWVVASRDREADLVVQLRRSRDVAVLLDVKAHAGVGQSWCWPP